MRPPKPEPPQVVLMGGAGKLWHHLLLIAVLAAFNVGTALALCYFDVGQRSHSQSTQSEGGGMHLSPVPIGPKLGNGLHLNPGWAP